MIFIHRASPEDAGQLTQIAISAKRYWNYPENWIRQWLPTLTISPEYISENEVWLAVADEMPVAYYSLILNNVVARSRGATRQSPSIMRGLLQVERFAHHLRNDDGVLWLDNLWILPEYMGQGIGSQLFQHALERSRAREASVLKIEADPNAQRFYEKMGAYKVGERHSEVDG